MFMIHFKSDDRSEEMHSGRQDYSHFGAFAMKNYRSYNVYKNMQILLSSRIYKYNGMESNIEIVSLNSVDTLHFWIKSDIERHGTENASFLFRIKALGILHPLMLYKLYCRLARAP
jgi:hypothetical protein